MVLNTIMVHDLLVCSAYQYQFSKNGTNVWKKTLLLKGHFITKVTTSVHISFIIYGKNIIIQRTAYSQSSNIVIYKKKRAF